MKRIALSALTPLVILSLSSLVAPQQAQAGPPPRLPVARGHVTAGGFRVAARGGHAALGGTVVAGGVVTRAPAPRLPLPPAPAGICAVPPVRCASAPAAGAYVSTTHVSLPAPCATALAPPPLPRPPVVARGVWHGGVVTAHGHVAAASGIRVMRVGRR